MAGTVMVRTGNVCSVPENSQVSDVFCTQKGTSRGSGDTGTKVRSTGWA
jgi:hypothetical protein